MAIQSLPAELCYLSATRLANDIASGHVSASDAVEACIERIEAVNSRLNALAVPLFDQARADASARDMARARSEPLGPLHGVPITIKECFDVVGTHSTIGIERFVGEQAAADAPLVEALRSAGAVIVGKTNVPQLMVLYETDNPVYGRANNPWNLDRSPGGSSGGEAASVAAGFSAIGLASDLGGSVRQPAHSCGVHGFKPTAGQLSMDGSRNAFRGMEALEIAPGLVARHVSDLRLGMDVLWSAAEVSHVRQDHGHRNRIEGLRVGYFTADAYFQPSPAIQRAVEEAASALADRVAIVEPWQPPSFDHAVHLFWELTSADGGADMLRLLGRSRRDRRVRRLINLLRVPRFARPALTTFLRTVGQRGIADLVQFTRARSADEYWRLTCEKNAYVQRFNAALDRAGIDVILCPAYGLPALKHGKSLFLFAAAGYSQAFNVLGMPSGVVAATKVRADEETRREISRDKVEHEARKVELGSAGLPVGVQVTARPRQDRLVLDVMDSLEEAFRATSDYPARPLL